MTVNETILDSSVALRRILALNPDVSRVTFEKADGVWSYRRGEGLEYRIGERTLKVPATVFDAADAEAWEVVSESPR